MKKLLLITAILTATFSNAQTDTLNQLTCNLKTDEVDEFTGSTKKVLYEERFIEHTDSSLIKYYKKKKHQYIELDIFLAKINDVYAMYTFWRIDTENAYKYFGSLREDAKLIVKFTDGSVVTLLYDKSDFGDTNYDLKYTNYSSYISLNEEIHNELKNKTIEKVRMYWSEGYEEYPVKDGEIIKRQLNCLSK